jgi:hypothetical protein
VSVVATDEQLLARLADGGGDHDDDDDDVLPPSPRSRRP